MGTLAISIVSLALAAVAYWRSGGKQDAKRVRLEIERLKAKEKEMAESITQTLAAAYEASRQRLQYARELLRQTKDEAIRGVEQQLRRAQAQLEALGRKLEEAAHSAKETSVSAARNVERTISLRVRRIEARAMLLRAKTKMTLAISAASKLEFEKAEHRLDEATELWREAREVLADDHAYDQLFDAMKRSLRDATTALQSQAQSARAKIEEVLVETDRLVNSLEADEQRACDEETMTNPEQQRAAA